MKKILVVMLLITLSAAMGYGNGNATRTGHADSKDKDSITVDAKTHEDRDDEDSSDGRSHHQGHKDQHGTSHDKHRHGDCEHDDGPGIPANPIITSVTPSEVKAGDQIQISGSGFGASQGTGSVSINSALTPSIISWTDTGITAVVPANATTGPVVVTQTGGASSPGRVVVLWAKEYPENVAICTAANSQQARYQLISDGSGGAIMTWWDNRPGGVFIYAQRVNSAGTVLWAVDGVAIAPLGSMPDFPQITSDGSGGAIITWDDAATGIVRAQRVNSAGIAQWATDGVVLSAVTSDSMNLQAASDNTGGAIITWTSGDYKIHGQRVNSAGLVQWAVDGVAIGMPVLPAGLHSYDSYPRLISDGSGGAIIVWLDFRNGTDWDVYAQRVNSAGAVPWAVNGIAITAAVGHQGGHQLISDNAGGAIITWSDLRSGVSGDFAQRVDASGALQWALNGVAIAAPGSLGSYPQLVSDGSGGAIIIWTDMRNEIYGDLYAQGISASGRQ